MASNIFINYRKDDAKWNALSLYNELLKYFPAKSIFKDFNTIEPGEDFKDSINKALEQCNVLLVLIGHKWLNISDEKGIRLADPDDLVRFEIATALERNIRVIPVLFDDIAMPTKHYLPDNLKTLCNRQFVTVSDTKFEADIEKLAKAIKKILQDDNDDQLLPKEKVDPPIEQPAKNLIQKNSLDVLPPVIDGGSLTEKNIKRGSTSIILGLIGGLLTGIAVVFVYANDDRLRYGSLNIYKMLGGSAGAAVFFWGIIGAVAGSRRNYLLVLIISAIVGLIIWIAVFGTYQDTVWAAILFGMPLSSLLGIFICWLIKKI